MRVTLKLLGHALPSGALTSPIGLPFGGIDALRLPRGEIDFEDERAFTRAGYQYAPRLASIGSGIAR